MIEIILPSMQTTPPLTTTAFYSGSQNHLLLFNSNTKSTSLAKTFFHGLTNGHPFTQISFLHLKKSRAKSTRNPRASLIESPVLWAGRVCVFYVLLKAGLAGSSSSPILSSPSSDFESGLGDLGFTKWLSSFQKNPEKEAADRRKLVSKWHQTTKGTLKRNYRIPSKAEGRRLLKAIAALLSEDDHFVDASSHKGCQIRRESAHGESVCCNNVRALFDELPTPHLVVEITAFPAGPLTERDYTKAEKLERVLRSSPSV